MKIGILTQPLHTNYGGLLQAFAPQKFLRAADKAEFEAARERFLSPEPTERPMLFEIFTDDADESAALKAMMSLEESVEAKAKSLAKNILGDSGVKFAKKLLGR